MDTVAFDIWFKAVKDEVAKTGLNLDDLPDCTYADWFEDGVKPAAAAKRAIRNAKGYF